MSAKLEQIEIKTKINLSVDDLINSLTTGELTKLVLEITDVLEWHQLQAIQERVEAKLLTETEN